MAGLIIGMSVFSPSFILLDEISASCTGDQI